MEIYQKWDSLGLIYPLMVILYSQIGTNNFFPRTLEDEFAKKSHPPVVEGCHNLYTRVNNLRFTGKIWSCDSSGDPQTTDHPLKTGFSVFKTGGFSKS